MKQIKIIFVSCFLSASFFFSTGYSQQSWSLEKCITYALENNIQIKQQELEKRYNENLLFQSKADLFPSLNSDFDIGSTSGRALDQTTYQFSENQTIVSSSFSTTASLGLFNGFQKINTIKEKRLNLLASLKDLEKLRNDISLNIAAAYLQILLNMELLSAAQGQYKITQMQVERTEKLVNAGSVPKANLLEIQAQAATQEVQVVSAQNNLDISYLTLAQFLELESVNGFEIETPSIEIPESDEITGNVDSIYTVSSAVLPQIKSAEYKLLSAERGLKVAQGSRSPSLSMSGTYYTGYSDARRRITGIDGYRIDTTGYTGGGDIVLTPSPLFASEEYLFRQQFSDNYSTRIALNLTIPLFNGWRTNSAVSNAKISVLNSEYNLELAKNTLLREIQQSYADAKASHKKYKASQKALTAMEESFSYTQQRYEVGLVNITDYNAAQNQLAITKSELLQSKYEFIFKIKILDFYQGKPIIL